MPLAPPVREGICLTGRQRIATKRAWFGKGRKVHQVEQIYRFLYPPIAGIHRRWIDLD